MARQSLFDRYDPFIAAAVLSVHANTLKKGFRQHDVRIFIEVFTNWIDFSEDSSVLSVQNTQIARYLNALVEDGFARRMQRNRAPVYRLARTGLIELISRLVAKPHYPKRSHFHFVFYMVFNYRKRIIELVKREGKRFPYSMQLELESLLDLNTLVDRQIEHTKQQLRKLEKRIEEQIRSSELCDKMLQSGASFKKVVAQIDKTLPFAVNEYRRYADLLTMGTERQGLWEIQVGSLRRAKQLWHPARKELESYLKELNQIRAELKATL